MDGLSREHRSWNMSRIRGKDTSPEILLRSLLHRAGYRYRLHARDLPGRPDIVLPRYRTAIFVNGCFWHRHAGCSAATTPSTHREFWQDKFARNVERDQCNHVKLKASGWRVLVAWECELKSNPRSVVDHITAHLKKVI